MDNKNETSGETLTREQRINKLLDESRGSNIIEEKPFSEFPDDISNPEVKEEKTETGGTKVRIPASRLKTLTTKVSELEEKLKAAQAIDERISKIENHIESKQELPDWWKSEYGEGDAQLKAYKIFQRGLREQLKEELRVENEQKALEEAEREKKIASIEESFDNQMDELEESLGRKLTESQKEEIFDIIEEYSPMEDGKYTSYMSIQNAYNLANKIQKPNAAKTEMAKIADIKSSNTYSANDTGPLVHGSWRKKYGL